MSKKVRIARFVVPGDPVGFKTTTKRAKWSKTYKKYVTYKKDVQTCALAAGIRLPLRADKKNPLMINTIAYFKDGKHPDPGNVQKGVCDALFYNAGKGDDKYTGGTFVPPRYDKENPRVVVIIKDYVRKSNGKK